MLMGAVGQAEEVHPERQARPAPDQPAAPAVKEEQVDQRDDQDIARGQKAGLADRRMEQPDLLRQVGRAERRAAAHAADEQDPAGLPLFLRRLARMAGAVFMQHRHHRQQHDAANQAAREQKGAGADIVHAHALGDERHAPDRGGEQQKQGIAELHTGFLLGKMDRAARGRAGA